jgi:hypothetical protein
MISADSWYYFVKSWRPEVRESPTERRLSAQSESVQKPVTDVFEAVTVLGVK